MDGSKLAATSQPARPPALPDPLEGWPRMRSEPRRMFAILWASAGSRPGAVEVTWPGLVAAAGCSERSVRRRLATLEEAGLVALEKVRGGATIRVADPAAVRSELCLVHAGPIQRRLFDLDDDDPPALAIYREEATDPPNYPPAVSGATAGGYAQPPAVSAQPPAVIRGVCNETHLIPARADGLRRSKTVVGAGAGAVDVDGEEPIDVRLEEVGPLCGRLVRILWPKGRREPLSPEDWSLVTKAAWIAIHDLGEAWLLDAADAAVRRGRRRMAYLHQALATTLAQARGRDVETAEDRDVARMEFCRELKCLRLPPRPPPIRRPKAEDHAHED